MAEKVPKVVGKPGNRNAKPRWRVACLHDAARDSPRPRVGQPTSVMALPGQGQVTLGTSLLLAGLSSFICTMKTTLRCESRNQIRELERITHFIDLPNKIQILLISLVKNSPHPCPPLPSEPQQFITQLTDDRKPYLG